MYPQPDDSQPVPGQHTKRIKFGCAFNVLPMWHPLRLAEDFAMVDVLTGGRIIFGVGRGYHTREVETFGAPMLDAELNRDLFEEQFEIIIKGVQPGTIHPPRNLLHAASGGWLSGLPAHGFDAGAQAGASARGNLATHCQRQPQGHGLHGQAPDQRHDAGHRNRICGSMGSRLPGSQRPARSGFGFG